MLNIILLGDPAAGKATQAKILSKKHKLYDLDMGRELRLARRRDKKFDKILRRNYDKGNLTPTKLVRKIFRDKIFGFKRSQGILFDGGPKMLGEAKLVQKWLNQTGRKDRNTLVLYLHVPLKEVEKRMKNRKEYFKGKYSKRTDDTPDALKNRIKYYRKNIAEVVDFFKSKYQFKKVNGLGTIKQVNKRIEQIIDGFNQD